MTGGGQNPERFQPAATRWQSWAALLLLAVMFAQLLGAATQLSATVDEGFHITSGYEYLRTGELRLFDEHTPLVKALFAWPLLLVPDLPPPEQAPGWQEGDLIQVAQATVLAYRPIDRVIVPPRIVVALLTLILGATVFRWASRLFGATAGLFALALFAFDPNILAHGSLATTDMGAVLFMFWAVWLFARYLRTRGAEAGVRWRTWGVAGLALGLAQGAKLTALLLIPVLGAVVLIEVWRQAGGHRWPILFTRLLEYAGLIVIAAVVVWALYLFEWRASPDIAAGGLPLPAASHWERWVRLRQNLQYGRESFLLGQNSMHGWWAYFPIAFALKTPTPVLLLVLLTVAGLFRRRGRPSDELALGLFPVVYGAASLASSLNIGYRHLLPVLPFLFVSAGRVISGWGRDVFRYAMVGLLVVGLAIGSLAVFPHYLAYFNMIAGGADQGYRYLADSNTDWGQTLKALASYQRGQQLGPVKLSQFTFLDPAAYGVDYEPITPMTGAPPVLPRRFDPEPGVYAISTTTLDGVPLALPATFDWFRHREPLVRVGHTMFVYDVHEQEPAPGWVAQCMQPVSPLTPEAIAEGFGSGNVRRVYFDCEHSWVFPGGGATPGWYVRAIPQDETLRWPDRGQRLEWWPAWAGGELLEGLKLSYAQPRPGDLPPFAIWEWNGEPVAPPLTTAEGEVALDGTLTFLGYRAPEVVRSGETAEIWTFWRVMTPLARPLSLMLHLSGADGRPLAVGDGLGVPVDQWQPGDLIVQRHVLEIPADAETGEYRLLSGAYWLDDLSRLTAEGKSAILLGSVIFQP